MAIAYHISAADNVVLVRCSGRVTVAETLEAFERYTADSDFRPGQSQLIDLSEVEDYERDFTRIMSLQAHQAETYFSKNMVPGQETHLIYVAPNELTQKMAMSSLRSWKGIPGIVALVVHDVNEALDVLALDVPVQEAQPVQAS